LGDEAGRENLGHEAGDSQYVRFNKQTHRIVELICRYPRHKWRLKVWQFVLLRHHVANCYECNMRMDDLTRRYPQKPTIGPTPEVN
jgi:hypothetical protein